MKHWEFLLQKEGDRSWLPLDSPDVEILEGRYRVVARSSQKNVEVELRISHLATEEDPPKRRIQKRSARISQEGLLVVIPYTRLEPGLWELCCASTDLMSDLLGDAWQYAVKLQVLAKDRETDEWDSPWEDAASMGIESDDTESGDTESDDIDATEANFGTLDSTNTQNGENGHRSDNAVPDPISPPYPEPTPNSSTDLPPEVAEILGASMDRLFQLAEQMSNQLVDEVMQEFDTATMPEAISQTQPSTSAPPSNHPTPSNLEQPNPSPSIQHHLSGGYTLPIGTVATLTLDQEALVAHRGEGLTLSGQIELDDSSEISLTSPAEAANPVGSMVADPWEPTEAAAKQPDEAFTGATIQEIQLCLRDPQTLQVLVSDRRSIPDQPPPLPFSFSFSLPDDLQTRLVLGEVLLYGILPESETPLTTLLTTQAFTITADPQDLMGDLEKINEVLDETLTAHTDDEDRIDLPLELSQKLAKEQELPSFNLSFLELEPLEAPKSEPPHRFKSLLGQPLPPQIYQPDPAHPRTKPIELPGFVFPTQPPSISLDDPISDLDNAAPETPAQVSQTDGEVDGEAEQAISETTPPAPEAELTQSVPLADSNELAASQFADSQLTKSQEVSPTSEVVSESSHELTSQTEEELNAPSTSIVSGDAESEIQSDLAESPKQQAKAAEPPSFVDLPSPVEMSFEALKLQDRFLTRLNSIANDAELSEWLRSNLYPGKPVQPSRPGATEKAKRLTAEEVVVNDDPPSNRYFRQRNGFRKVNAGSNSDEPNPLILPPDEPVPTPVLEVTTMAELVAGKPVNIRVRLPHIEPRIYVKLWVIDRQTRSMLDGPRWLLDFLPNSRGELEVLTQLTVPFGSLEVLFEAIAIEMHTQRESHKVSVDRSVIPPDLPVVSLDDFDTRFY